MFAPRRAIARSAGAAHRVGRYAAVDPGEEGRRAADAEARVADEAKAAAGGGTTSGPPLSP